MDDDWYVKLLEESDISRDFRLSLGRLSDIGDLPFRVNEISPSQEHSSDDIQVFNSPNTSHGSSSTHYESSGQSQSSLCSSDSKNLTKPKNFSEYDLSHDSQSTSDYSTGSESQQNSSSSSHRSSSSGSSSFEASYANTSSRKCEPYLPESNIKDCWYEQRSSHRSQSSSSPSTCSSSISNNIQSSSDNNSDSTHKCNKTDILPATTYKSSVMLTLRTNHDRNNLADKRNSTAVVMAGPNCQTDLDEDSDKHSSSSGTQTNSDTSQNHLSEDRTSSFGDNEHPNSSENAQESDSTELPLPDRCERRKAIHVEQIFLERCPDDSGSDDSLEDFTSHLGEACDSSSSESEVEERAIRMRPYRLPTLAFTSTPITGSHGSMPNKSVECMDSSILSPLKYCDNEPDKPDLSSLPALSLPLADNKTSDPVYGSCPAINVQSSKKESSLQPSSTDNTCKIKRRKTIRLSASALTMWNRPQSLLSSAMGQHQSYSSLNFHQSSQLSLSNIIDSECTKSDRERFSSHGSSDNSHGEDPSKFPIEINHVSDEEGSKAEQQVSRPVSIESDVEEGADVIKRERRREKIIKEIMATEQTYQQHLELIVKYFEQPLRWRGILEEHVIDTIFSNVQQLMNLNAELWHHLTTVNVGQAFLSMGAFFKLYSTYANNHERALATLMESEQKYSTFADFRRRQEEEEEMKGLKLNALLITPVQRIPRYKMLLEDLLKNTSSEHEDYAAIQEACNQIGSVATHINEHIKQQDNFMKMFAIQKSLGPTAPKLLIPGRVFIKEGTLKKVSKNGTSFRERQFFLFSDILVYGKNKLLEGTARHSYVCCCILPLQHCNVARVFGHGYGDHALFNVTCKDESLLLFSDRKAVDIWIDVITKSINTLLERRQTLRKPSNADEPLRKVALAKLKKEEERKDPLRASQHKKGSPRWRKSMRQQKKTETPKIGNCQISPCKKQKILGDIEEKPGAGSSPRSLNLSPRIPIKIKLGCLTPRGRKKKNSEDHKENQFEEKKTIEEMSCPPGPDGIDLEPSQVWYNESAMTGMGSILSPAPSVVVSSLSTTVGGSPNLPSRSVASRGITRSPRLRPESGASFKERNRCSPVSSRKRVSGPYLPDMSEVKDTSTLDDTTTCTAGQKENQSSPIKRILLSRVDWENALDTAKHTVKMMNKTPMSPNLQNSQCTLQ